MPSTADKSVTLPTPQELEEAVKHLQDATAPFARIAWSVERCEGIERDEDDPRLRQPDDEVPSFEHIGRLFDFVESARMELDEITGNVDRVAAGLSGLNLARLSDGEIKSA